MSAGFANPEEALWYALTGEARSQTGKSESDVAIYLTREAIIVAGDELQTIREVFEQGDRDVAFTTALAAVERRLEVLAWLIKDGAR